jgi:hypothetical protein
MAWKVKRKAETLKRCLETAKADMIKNVHRLPAAEFPADLMFRLIFVNLREEIDRAL